MKAVIQRVTAAAVTVAGKTVGQCGNGFLILFCAVAGDTEKDLEILIKKTAALRVFGDAAGKMNRCLAEVDGEVLCISQFTLCADLSHGNRPSFFGAMEPQAAEDYYSRFCAGLRAAGVRRVEQGVFGADMQVSLCNDGPVTILMDSKVWCKE